MRSSKFIAAIFASALLVGSAVGQSASDWRVLDPVYDGETTLDGQAYHYGPNGIAIQPVHWKRDWGSGLWELNGVPVGFSPFQPFGDPVVENHNVTAHSEGTVTLRVEWIGAGSAPATVVVMIRSTSTAEYTRPVPFGWGTVDNGLSAGITTMRAEDNMEVLSESSLEVQELTVNNGIAEYTLTKSAHAQCPTGYISGRVWADASQAVLYLKQANVLVDLNGFQTRKKTLTQTASHTITPYLNPHHNVMTLDPANAVTMTWNTTTRAAVDPSMSTSSNYALFKLSVATKMNFDSYWQQLDKHIWTGVASAHRSSHPEYYEWTSGSSGTFHCHICSDFVIPDQEREHWPHSFYTQQGSNWKSARWQPGWTGLDTMQLEYTWGASHSPCPDSVPAEIAYREAQFVEPRILVDQTGQILSPSPHLIPVYIEEVNGYLVPAGISHNNVTGFVAPPWFNTQAAITISGHATDLTGAMNNPYAKVVAGVAAVAGASIEMYRESKDPMGGITKIIPNQQYCWWYVNNIESEVPPSNWSSTQNYYQWEAFIRPNKELSAEVVDKYDKQGYFGRMLVQHSYDGPADNGTEFRRYYYNSAPPPTGGSGNQGGS
jgi:hypothetical protein